MASCFCTTCKKLMCTMHNGNVNGDIMDGEGCYLSTIAKGNIIEGMEAKE